MEEKPIFFLRDKQTLKMSPFCMSDIEKSAEQKSNWDDGRESYTVGPEDEYDTDYPDEDTCHGVAGYLGLENVVSVDGAEVTLRQDLGHHSNGRKYEDGYTAIEVDESFEVLNKDGKPIEAINLNLEELEPENDENNDDGDF